MLTEHLKFNEYKIGLIRAALNSEYGYVTPGRRPVLLEQIDDLEAANAIFRSKL